MRRVRLSKTFLDQLDILLEQGYPRFGERVIVEKRNRVFDVINDHISNFPKIPIDPSLGLCVYSVSQTPFVLIYDFDEAELRVHFILHGGMDRSNLDPTIADW